MFEISPESLALLIPIVAILGGIAIAIAGIIMNGRKEELKQKERLLALEKGIAIPEAPKVVCDERPSYLGMRAGGFVMSFLGIIIFIGIWASAELRHAVWGLIPFAIGAGLLLAAWLEKRDMRR